MHTEKPKPAFYHPVKAASEVNISLSGCEPGGEEGHNQDTIIWWLAVVKPS